MDGQANRGNRKIKALLSLRNIQLTVDHKVILLLSLKGKYVYLQIIHKAQNARRVGGGRSNLILLLMAFSEVSQRLSVI